MSDDCAGEPPGEFISMATADGFSLNACFSTFSYFCRLIDCELTCPGRGVSMVPAILMTGTSAGRFLSPPPRPRPRPGSRSESKKSGLSSAYLLMA